MAFIPNIPSSLGAISEFDKAITELLRHGAGELSSRIQLLIEDMLTRWLALDERIAARIKRFYRQGAVIWDEQVQAAVGLLQRRPCRPRRFPSPWSVEETDACFIVRYANGQALD